MRVRAPFEVWPLLSVELARYEVEALSAALPKPMPGGDSLATLHDSD